MIPRSVLIIVLLQLTLGVQACWDNTLEDRENISECTTLAEQGDPQAQANMGSMYYSGAGVPRNYRKTMMWYKESAGQDWMGASGSHVYVGMMYSQGLGVAKNYKLAKKWFVQAAEMGNGTGQYSLGIMYRNGNGTPRDNLKAHMWLSISAKSSGLSSAVRYRDRVAKKLTVTQLEKSKILVDQWLAAHP